MEDSKEYLTWLSANGITGRRANHYALVIQKMENAGISENDLLTGDVVAVTDEYISIVGEHYTNRTRGQFRYIIRKYRQFRGFPDAVGVAVKYNAVSRSSIDKNGMVNDFIDMFGISFSYANTMCCIIVNLLEYGISEQDILTRSSNYLTDKYLSIVKHDMKDKNVVKRSVAHYRMYKNVPLGDAAIGSAANYYNRIVKTESDGVSERESFLKWFSTRYTCQERGQTYYRDICRIRDSGVPDGDMLNLDERDVCDYYCRITNKELSRSMMKEYRTAVRHFKSFKEVTA